MNQCSQFNHSSIK